MRDVTDADIASLRSFMERALYAALVVNEGKLTSKRIALEKCVEHMSRAKPEDRTNTVAEVLRAIDLFRSIENGLFQPAPYRKPAVVVDNEEE
jgi:hypothetical protein